MLHLHKKNWGRLDEIPGRAQGGWRLRHSRKVKENQTLVPWIEIRGHMDGGGNRFIITFFLFYFCPGCPQDQCHMAAINCPIGHVPSKYQKVYLPSQEEVRK